MKNALLSIMLFLNVLNFSVNAAESNSENSTEGLDHIGLSVSDLDASTQFFVKVLDFKVRGRDSKYPAVFMNNGHMGLTLWQTDKSSTSFDRKKNVGLHHLAIKVPSFDALESLYQVIKELPNVTIEFSPELSYGGPAKHMMIREPSGNRIELIHRPAKK